MFSDEAGADEGFDDFGDAFPMGETSLTAQEPTAQEGLTEQLQNRPYATEVVDSRFGKAVDNLVNLLVLEGEYMPKATTAHTQQQELNQTSDAFQFPTNNLRTSGISQNARGIIRYSNQGTPVARAGSTHTEPVFSSALSTATQRAQPTLGSHTQEQAMLLGYIDDNGTTPNHMQFHPYGVHSTYGFPVPSNSTSGIPDPARAYLGDGQGTVWSQTPNLAGYGVGSNMNWASVQHNPIVDLPALVGSTATSSNVFSTPVSQATGSTTIAVAHQPSELKFTSLKRFNRNRKAAFKCPHPDPTIPTTDAGQCQVVKGFISSMKNTTGVIDKEDTSRFLKRWKAKRRGTYYSDEDFETAAWTLYGKLEKLHSNDKGWTHDIKDANLMQEIRETKDWSFAKRVQEINNLLRLSKTNCDSVLQNRKLHDIIGRPTQVLGTVRMNSILNRKRAEQKAALERRVISRAQTIQAPTSSHASRPLAPIPSLPLDSHYGVHNAMPPYPPFPSHSEQWADLPNFGFENVGHFKNTSLDVDMSSSDPSSALTDVPTQGFGNPFERTHDASDGGEPTNEPLETSQEQGGELGFGEQGRNTEE